MPNAPTEEITTVDEAKDLKKVLKAERKRVKALEEERVKSAIRAVIDDNMATCTNRRQFTNLVYLASNTKAILEIREKLINGKLRRNPFGRASGLDWESLQDGSEFDLSALADLFS